MYAAADLDLKPYDAYDLDHEIWQFRMLKKMGIEIKESDFADIKNVIQDATDSAELSHARAQAKAEAWQYEGEAGKLTADFMINKLNSLNRGSL